MRNPKNNLFLALTVLAAVVLVSLPAEARTRYRRHKQEVRERGNEYTQGGLQIYGGFGSQGYEILDQDYGYIEEIDSEDLGFVGVSYGVTRRLALFLELAGSEHQTARRDMVFGYMHVGFKFAPNVGRRHRWQPYGKASVGGIFLVEDDSRHHLHNIDKDDGYSGPSVALSLGIDRFISRRAALFTEVGLMMGRLDNRIINGRDHALRTDIGVSSGRLLFGLRFRL